MKRIFLLVPLLTAAASLASAQLARPVTDVLGAHLNYGRGCVACHAPHNGSADNGTMAGGSGQNSAAGLWGADATSLYGKALSTGGGKFVEVLPTSVNDARPDSTGILTCLACHDGNYSKSAMMRNVVYETLPASYAGKSMPTLLGVNGPQSYLQEHPMGLTAKIKCGGAKNWDCTISNGTVLMKGSRSSQFVKNYGFFVKPGAYQQSAVVTCLTCHDPHKMNVVTVSSGSVSGLASGNYATTFFLRGPYNVADTNPNSNQAAQFCRQCHAELSNEMNGSTAGTIF